MTQVIVRSGGSSAGKSTMARALPDVLPGLWLTFGTDVAVDTTSCSATDCARRVAEAVACH